MPVLEAETVANVRYLRVKLTNYEVQIRETSEITIAIRPIVKLTVAIL